MGALPTQAATCLSSSIPCKGCKNCYQIISQTVEDQLAVTPSQVEPRAFSRRVRLPSSTFAAPISTPAKPTFLTFMPRFLLGDWDNLCATPTESAGFSACLSELLCLRTLPAFQELA